MRSGCMAHGPRADLRSGRRKAPRRTKKQKRARRARSPSGTSRSLPSITSVIPVEQQAPRRAANPPSHRNNKHKENGLQEKRSAQVLRFYFSGGRRSSSVFNKHKENGLQEKRSAQVLRFYFSGGRRSSSVAGFRYSPRQRTAKCRCGPVDRPVPPLSARSWPAATFSPSFTLNSERCM